MTTTTHPETQIVVDPDVPLVRIVREFDAPPEKVFRAHVDLELFARWTGPKGMEIRIDRHDCRTGGAYRYVMSQDGEDYGFNGVFHEVRPNELIVQTFAFEGMPDDVALERLVLEDLGNGRTRLTSTSLVDSFEGRDGFVASGMEVGVNEGYEKLDDLLARDEGGAR
ncbi:SRPBCC family protein [Blastococcus brunescens]|uniref:SRPBCC family protein n=1 Tax=Blastococcus brunescens TaxID=1564165 RepID=A0ABZ1AY64_9ACTN|nr:SRPBCC family protein [Blastococcus sp. BMG 8361]WRL63507.1 SRPBCC family protein [Blastococcus sp. BMG 8361]